MGGEGAADRQVGRVVPDKGMRRCDLPGMADARTILENSGVGDLRRQGRRLSGEWMRDTHQGERSGQRQDRTEIRKKASLHGLETFEDPRDQWRFNIRIPVKNESR